jgi:hypothetical protein
MKNLTTQNLSSIPKNKTLIFIHEKKGQSGPVFGLIVLCVLDAWERDQFFVSWCLGIGALTLFSRHLETQNNLQDWALLFRGSKESHAMKKFTYA